MTEQCGAYLSDARLVRLRHLGILLECRGFANLFEIVHCTLTGRRERRLRTLALRRCLRCPLQLQPQMLLERRSLRIQRRHLAFRSRVRGLERGHALGLPHQRRLEFVRALALFQQHLLRGCHGLGRVSQLPALTLIQQGKPLHLSLESIVGLAALGIPALKLCDDGLYHLRFPHAPLVHGTCTELVLGLGPRLHVPLHAVEGGGLLHRPRGWRRDWRDVVASLAGGCLRTAQRGQRRSRGGRPCA